MHVLSVQGIVYAIAEKEICLHCFGAQNQSEQSEAVKMVKCAQTVRNRKKSF